MSNKSSLNERLEQSKVTGKQGGIYASVISGHFLDGYMINVIGVTMMGLVAAFHLNASQMGFMASSVYYGMCFGALFGGPIADRFGRKKVFITAIIIFSLASIGCAAAPTYGVFLAFRLLTGVGLGIEVPVSMTFIHEYMPVKIRAISVASATFFWTIASVAASLLGLWLMRTPDPGWRWMFAAGVVPVVIIIPALIIVVPESVHFLLTRGKVTEAKAIVDKVSSVPGDDTADEAALETANKLSVAEQISVKGMFHGKFTLQTICVWLMNLICGFVFFGLGSWLPGILMKMGFDFVHSLSYTAAISLSGAIGSLIGGYFIHKFGFRITMTGFFLIAGVSAIVWGTTGSSTTMIIWALLTSMFGFGAGGLLFVYVTSLYPSSVRATGTAWAAFSSRVGGLIAPVVLGVIVASPNIPNIVFFLCLGIPLLIACVIALTTAIDFRGKTLEDVHAKLLEGKSVH